MVPRKLLVLILVLYAVWRVLVAVGARRRRTAARAEDFSRFSARRRDREPFRRPAETLVPCSRCGVHVPEGRLVSGKSGRYCSETCRDEAEGGDRPVEEPPDGRR